MDVLVAPQLVEQALASILNNAIEAPRPNGTEPTVWVTGSAGKGSVVVRVRDDGTGIRDADPTTPLAAIPSTKGRPAVRLRAPSRRSRATVLDFGSWRPASREPRSRSPSRLASAVWTSIDRREPYASSVAPALVIDDDVALLKSLEQAARLSGIRIVTASTWDEGLETFQVLSPSVVVADFNMPGSRHGLQLLAKIRQLRPSVRLILVSAYLDERDIDAVMALGVVDRALTKGSAAETAEAVLEEARSAVELEHTPTDWVAYAQAFR